MRKNTIIAIVFTVWPIVVIVAFGGLSHITSSYFTFATLFAFAAMCHIPIFFGWVFNKFAAGTRWPITLMFVIIQTITLPACLKVISSG